MVGLEGGMVGGGLGAGVGFFVSLAHWLGLVSLEL